MKEWLTPWQGPPACVHGCVERGSFSADGNSDWTLRFGRGGVRPHGAAGKNESTALNKYEKENEGTRMDWGKSREWNQLRPCRTSCRWRTCRGLGLRCQGKRSRLQKNVRRPNSVSFPRGCRDSKVFGVFCQRLEDSLKGADFLQVFPLTRRKLMSCNFS